MASVTTCAFFVTIMV